ncbi:MAG: LysR family transcriptional regulator [Pseudomonadota bacterium]|nr:LysR family transcriptional regulator [Pseudomonadota bacterium]
MTSNRQRGLLMNYLDLNLLRVFDALMAERSVTRAAERIGRTQSAVSHALNRLREIFEDELFSRDGKTMEATPRARELASVVSVALSDILSAIDRHLNFEPSESRRHFWLGLSDYTAVGFLPEFTRRFTREAPNAKLNIVNAVANDVLPLLRTGELDCAVLANAPITSSEFNNVVLSIDRIVCAAWRGNPIIRNSMSLKTFCEAAHLQISSDGVAEGTADIMLRQRGLSRNVVATIPYYLVAPWVIKSTDLLTIFGDRMMLVIDAASETAMLPTPIALPDLQVSLLYGRRVQAEPGNIWLRRLIMDVSEQQTAVKDGVAARSMLQSIEQVASE